MPSPTAPSTQMPPRVLALSSQVAFGHVGLSAILPVLHRFGIEVVALPTVVLSSHPGHGRTAGQPICADILAAMIATLEINGWLNSIDAILLGYLPSADHVALAVDTIERIRSRAAIRPLVLCDPVIGDDPKGVYIADDAAVAIRDRLCRLADIATPNRFELAWLSGLPVVGPDTAVAAAGRVFPAGLAVATSIPLQDGRIANVAAKADHASMCAVDRRASVPNGTGDVFSALLLARLLHDRADIDGAIGYATAALDRVVARSAGLAELSIIPAADDWFRSAPYPVGALND